MSLIKDKMFTVDNFTVHVYKKTELGIKSAPVYGAAYVYLKKGDEFLFEVRNSDIVRCDVSIYFNNKFQGKWKVTMGARVTISNNFIFSGADTFVRIIFYPEYYMAYSLERKVEGAIPIPSLTSVLTTPLRAITTAGSFFTGKGPLPDNYIDKNRIKEINFTLKEEK